MLKPWLVFFVVVIVGRLTAAKPTCVEIFSLTPSEAKVFHINSELVRFSLPALPKPITDKTQIIFETIQLKEHWPALTVQNFRSWNLEKGNRPKEGHNDVLLKNLGSEYLLHGLTILEKYGILMRTLKPKIQELVVLREKFASQTASPAVMNYLVSEIARETLKELRPFNSIKLSEPKKPLKAVTMLRHLENFQMSVFLTDIGMPTQFWSSLENKGYLENQRTYSNLFFNENGFKPGLTFEESQALTRIGFRDRVSNNHLFRGD